MTSAIAKRRVMARADGAKAYQKRRDEIAAAAARVFNERGFKGTTISAVADELSIDRATLYYYISSKEDLFDEVIREVTEENIANARHIHQSEVDSCEKLEQLIIDLMSSYGRHYPLLYIYIRENLDQVADKRSNWAVKMKKMNHDYEEIFISVIEDGYADGSFRDVGAPDVVAYGILGMVGWTNRWFKPGRSVIKAEEVGRIYAELILAGLESGDSSATDVAKKGAGTNRA